MIGVVQVRELVPRFLEGESLDVRALIRTAPVVPDTLDALDALNVLREAEVPMALVHDEYGHFDGVVTPADYSTRSLALSARTRARQGNLRPYSATMDRGSWQAGCRRTRWPNSLESCLPEKRDYETVAGLVIGELQHLPAVGEGSRLWAGASKWSTLTGDALTRSSLRECTLGIG